MCAYNCASVFIVMKRRHYQKFCMTGFCYICDHIAYGVTIATELYFPVRKKQERSAHRVLESQFNSPVQGIHH